MSHEISVASPPPLAPRGGSGTGAHQSDRHRRPSRGGTRSGAATASISPAQVYVPDRRPVCALGNSRGAAACQSGRAHSAVEAAPTRRSPPPTRSQAPSGSGRGAASGPHRRERPSIATPWRRYVSLTLSAIGTARRGVRPARGVPDLRRVIVKTAVAGRRPTGGPVRRPPPRARSQRQLRLTLGRAPRKVDGGDGSASPSPVDAAIQARGGCSECDGGGDATGGTGTQERRVALAAARVPRRAASPPRSRACCCSSRRCRSPPPPRDPPPRTTRRPRAQRRS